MKNSQVNELSMWMTTRDYLIQNSTITNSFPGFSTLMNSFTNGITAIHSYAEIQLTDKTGVTESKNALKVNLIGIAYEVSSKLRALAVNTGNTVLLNEVHFSHTSLKFCQDNILKEHCQLIYDRANANATALAPYGINAQAITNFLNTLNSFIAYIPKIRMSVSEKAQATYQLSQQFNSIRDVLEKIDILTETIRYSQPVFYIGYKASRRIWRTGYRTLALIAKVTDAMNNKPISGAHIIVNTAENSEFKTIEKKSAAKGGIRVGNLAEGHYLINISVPGYEPKEMEVYIKDSELTSLNISMARKLSA